MEGTAAKRLQVLSGHVAETAHTGSAPVVREHARAHAALPRFDTTAMEKYIDDLADLKEEVYETFRRRPDLLPPIIEDLTKGESWRLGCGSSGHLTVWYATL